jgi:hypothetical protein
MKANPTNFLVVRMHNGFVMEIKGPSKNKPHHDHLTTAVNAVKKLREGYQGDGEWVATTNIRLAEIHRKEWSEVNV